MRKSFAWALVCLIFSSTTSFAFPGDCGCDRNDMKTCQFFYYFNMGPLMTHQKNGGTSVKEMCTEMRKQWEGMCDEAYDLEPNAPLPYCPGRKLRYECNKVTIIGFKTCHSKDELLAMQGMKDKEADYFGINKMLKVSGSPAVQLLGFLVEGAAYDYVKTKVVEVANYVKKERQRRIDEARWAMEARRNAARNEQLERERRLAREIVRDGTRPIDMRDHGSRTNPRVLPGNGRPSNAANMA